MAEDFGKNNDRSLTILQWNCRGFVNSRVELINAIEKEEIDPDVICLQEMYKSSTLKGYKLVSYQFNKDQRAGVGTFIKHNIAHQEINTNFISPKEKQYCKGFRILGQSQDLDIYNIYVSPSEHNNLSILTEINNNTKNNTIILGDLNAHDELWDPSCSRSDSKGKSIINFLDQTDYALLNNGGETFDSSHLNSNSLSTGTTPDITMASPQIAAHTTWHPLDTTMGSDHYPILIKVFTPHRKTTQQSVPKWKFHKADWDRFKLMCKNKLNIDLRQNTTKQNSEFVSTLYEISTECIPQTSGKPHNRPTNPWWTQECSEALQHREICLRKWKKAAHSHRFHKIKRNYENKELRKKAMLAKENYLEAKQIANKTIKTAQQKGWQTFISEITSDKTSKEIWDKFNRLRGKPYEPIKPIQHGK